MQRVGNELLVELLDLSIPPPRGIMPDMRHLTLTLALALLLQTALTRAADEMAIVQDAQPRCTIVLSAQASASEKRGAAELQSHIRQMSGATLPIITDKDPLPASAILIGRSRHSESLGLRLDLNELGPEGFILRTTGQHLIIGGGRIRGSMYGCTALLEKLGVRWYTPKVTLIPKKPTITITALDEKHIPAFEYREPYFTEAQEKDWAARLRINGSNAHLDQSTGGKITYHPFVHTFDALVPPALYEQHPEYFPLIKGKRTAGYVQRCLTNPDVLKLAIEKVMAWMKERPDAGICSVSQNDTANWCQCEDCMAIVGKHGAHSGLYLWFVNQVAQAVEKQHPDKLIDTLAYQFTEPPPKDIAPRKNVRVRLCPIRACEAHPYEKCSAEPTVEFVKNLRGWAAITDTLYIWHYNTNFAHYLMPFPDFDEFPADLRLYRNSGVKGIFFEGAYGPGGGGSDADLRSYVMAKLLWDPTLDSDALVNEWMAGVYGPAAVPMRKWFDILHAKVRDPSRHFFIYDPPTVYYLTPEIIKAGDELFDQAQKTAVDPNAAHYVAKARLGLRYVKLMRNPSAGPELASFVADVRKFGIAQISEGKTLEAWEQQYRKTAPPK